MRASWIALALMVVACGGDDEGAPAVTAPPGGGAPRPPAAAKKPGAAQPLTSVRRIEDKVACPTPTDAKKCDPVAPVCGSNDYCLAAGTAHYCGPCPERDAIRHVFKPRDFQGSDIRDPFQSFVLGTNLGTTPEGEIDRTQRCTRREQMVATNYGYQSLKLVGIVSQGTQRKALMMDAGNLGHIIKKGDCVGKEKAWVKDIGAGYITFTIDKTVDPNNPTASDSEEQAVQLYPTQVSVTAPMDDPGARTPAAPIVRPPSSSGAAPQQPPAGGSIRIEPPPPQAQPAPQIVLPPPAPTQINP